MTVNYEEKSFMEQAPSRSLLSVVEVAGHGSVPWTIG